MGAAGAIETVGVVVAVCLGIFNLSRGYQLQATLDLIQIADRRTEAISMIIQARVKLTRLLSTLRTAEGQTASCARSAPDPYANRLKNGVEQIKGLSNLIGELQRAASELQKSLEDPALGSNPGRNDLVWFSREVGKARAMVGQAELHQAEVENLLSMLDDIRQALPDQPLP